MTAKRRVRILAAALLGLVVAFPPAPRADEGDKPGWSFASDPRKRAFLKYVAEKDGPRLLLIACLRDADLFTVSSTGLAEGKVSGVTLSLSNGAARYEVPGDIEPEFPSGLPTFNYETDADGQALKQIGASLMPVLSGKAAVVLTLGTAKRELPIAGLAAPLRRFAAICFKR
jgi:hypothetical protein